MRLVNSEEQRTVFGGAKHYHWFCSKNRFLSNQHKTKEKANYYSGVHAGKYNHGKYMSIFKCGAEI